LCNFTGRRYDDDDDDDSTSKAWLSGLVHENAHPVVPDIAQFRLECIDAGWN